MKGQIRFAALALLCAALLLPTGCQSKSDTPPARTEGETEGEEHVSREPTPEDTTDYDLLSRVPFEGLESSPEADFTVSETANGVTVTGYVGSATKVRIPERIGGKPVTALADGAFRDQKTVRVLWIADSVTVFGENVLGGMEQLYALHTPLPDEDGKRFIGWLFGATAYERNNVEGMRRITNLEIGGAATALPDHALFDCNDLVTLRLSDRITAIGDYALARCASLKLLDASTLRTVGTGALLGCTALRELTFGEDLEKIGRGALDSCNGLRRLTLPFVGESRETNRFLGWLFGAETAALSPGLYPTGLTELTLNGGGAVASEALYAAPIATLRITGGVTELGARALADCTSLTTLTLPASLTAIRENAFSGCTALREVTLPEGLTALGVNAFLGCTALESVVLPETLTALSACAFMGCARLARVTLGGVTAVGVNAFRGCTSLTELKCAHSVTFAEGNSAAEALLGNAP